LLQLLGVRIEGGACTGQQQGGEQEEAAHGWRALVHDQK
jgi:hypothetical protein